MKPYKSAVTREIRQLTRQLNKYLKDWQTRDSAIYEMRVIAKSIHQELVSFLLAYEAGMEVEWLHE